MGATRELVSFIHGLRFEQLPPAVVEKTKLCMLNMIGVMLAGASTRIGKMHIELAKESGGGIQDATLIGDGTKTSVAFATYANGNLGFALDYEDTVRYIIHPGYITVSSGLAVAEKLKLSGQDLIAAVVAGYESTSRIAVAMQPSPERGTQVWGEQYHPFAAAATAGHLMKLDENALDSAFGIAGTYATVPSVYKYFGPVADSRPMREIKLGWGWMGMAGVMATLSASKGFRGGHGVLDGKQGFWIMAGSDRCDFERMTAGLGQNWMILETEFKIHPSIAWNHPAYEATRLLVQNHDLKAAQVERIIIKGMMTPTIDDKKPFGAVDAQFSLPYTVASTIMGEPLLPRMYDDDKINDPQMQALLACTEVIHDRAADAAFFNEQKMIFSVAIETRDGKRFDKAVEFPRDKPEFGRPEVEKKFRELAATCLAERKINQIEDMINNLDRVDDVTKLVQLLY